MGTIKCTARLLNELGIKPIVILSQPTGLFDWYAKLLRMVRKNCVLVYQGQTPYSLLILIVKKPSLTEFGHLFRLSPPKSLMIEGLGHPNVRRTLATGGAIEITKISSCSVPGSMNGLALQVKYIIHCPDSSLGYKTS